MTYDQEEIELITEPEEYLVHGKRSTHIWLEVLHGDDQGIRVSVPRYRDGSDGIEEQLATYEENDVVTVTLESPTKTPPQWQIREVYDE